MENCMTSYLSIQLFTVILFLTIDGPTQTFFIQ